MQEAKGQILLDLMLLWKQRLLLCGGDSSSAHVPADDQSLTGTTADADGERFAQLLST